MEPLRFTYGTLRVVLFALVAPLFAGCNNFTELLPDDPLANEEPSGDEWAAMLDAVNAARAESRHCGATRYASAVPLVWNDRLETAARRHTEDMRVHEHFDHTGTDGSTVGVRADRAGYDWRRVGENIARYQDSVDEVVGDWLASPSHCANLMHPTFTEMGAAESGHYWTQVFGRER